MAKTSGGAGRYKGVRNVGGLSVNLSPSDAEIRRAVMEAEDFANATRGIGGYNADRASLLVSAAKSRPDINPNKIIIRDANGKLQAAAAWREQNTSIYLGLLGSRGGGGGSTALRQLYRIAISKNKPLTLSALELAKPFYRKMGMTEKGYSSFEISVPEMQAILSKGG